MVTTLLFALSLSSATQTSWDLEQSIDGFSNQAAVSVVAHNSSLDQLKLSCNNKKLGVSVQLSRTFNNPLISSHAKVDDFQGLRVHLTTSNNGYFANRSGHWANWPQLLRQMSDGKEVKFRFSDQEDTRIVSFQLTSGIKSIKKVLSQCNVI